eukprot:766195-Hanusia_phi.AAC.12
MHAKMRRRACGRTAPSGPRHPLTDINRLEGSNTHLESMQCGTQAGRAHADANVTTEPTGQE